MSYAPQARSARLVRVLICTIFVAAGLSAGRAAIAQTTGWQKGAAMPAAFVPRWDQSYAYFPPSDQVVLFGGSPKVGNDGWSNQTWFYQSGVWKSGPAAPSGLT